MDACTPLQPATGAHWRLSMTDTALSLFTRSVNGVGTPGITLGTMGTSKTGAIPTLLLGDTLEFDNLPFTFIIDSEFSNYKTLYNKIYNLATDNTPVGEEIDITLLDSDGGEIGFTERMYYAHPVALSGFQLVSTGDGVNVLTATVTFEFQDMRIADDNE